jgi:hypothetical protein
VDVEGLKSRDDALARMFSAPPQLAELAQDPRPTVAARDTHPAAPPAGKARPTPDAPSSRVEAEAPPTAAVATPRPPQSQKQLRGLLWGLLAVGGLLALGLGAAVSLLARGSGNAEQVVVVGGDRFESEPARPLGATPSEAPHAPGMPESASADAVTEPLPGALDPKPTAAAAPARRASTEQLPKTPGDSANTPRAPAAKEGGQDLQQKLARAVEQQSGSFQDCFTVNLNSDGSGSAAVLHFSVARQGGSAQVNVEPPSVATTPLGSCLEKAGRQVQFPTLAEAVSFRVPVRARVTRTRQPK